MAFWKNGAVWFKHIVFYSYKNQSWRQGCARLFMFGDCGNNFFERGASALRYQADRLAIRQWLLKILIFPLRSISLFIFISTPFLSINFFYYYINRA